ncbi:hypothetical protein P154DRAFT_536267 [Amniculicola lignicola CBS 123094]|uniref:Uncharacterized protein n=1 Tax=Amniculicola lignicola CBS 123094 TaxID=1392246 RepID=A0A6A5WEE2_9PLEO|nr:hypothetical protein P154DRAFT_536267 [Amniculicola lignicola CBS 123094]
MSEEQKKLKRAQRFQLPATKCVAVSFTMKRKSSEVVKAISSIMTASQRMNLRPTEHGANPMSKNMSPPQRYWMRTTRSMSNRLHALPLRTYIPMVLISIRDLSAEVPFSTDIHSHGNQAVKEEDITEFMPTVTRASAASGSLNKMSLKQLGRILSTQDLRGDEAYLEDYHSNALAGLRSVEMVQNRPGLLMEKMTSVLALDPNAPRKLGSTTFQDNRCNIWQVKWQMFVQIMGFPGEDPICCPVTSRGQNGFRTMAKNRKSFYVEVWHVDDPEFIREDLHRELILHSDDFRPSDTTMVNMSEWQTIRAGDPGTFFLGYLDEYSTNWLTQMAVFGFQVGQIPRILVNQEDQMKIIAQGKAIETRFANLLRDNEESSDDSEGE